MKSERSLCLLCVSLDSGGRYGSRRAAVPRPAGWSRREGCWLQLGPGHRAGEKGPAGGSWETELVDHGEGLL